MSDARVRGNGPLVLTRRVGEDIILMIPGGSIGPIGIHFVEVATGRTKMAINSPPSVGIFRSEIFEQMLRRPIPSRPCGSLVLSRKTKEDIVVIPQPNSLPRVVFITVCSQVGNKVRVAFSAEQSIVVFRKEVFDRIETDRQRIQSR